MELTTQHRIFYSNKELIPLSEVAESLLALEKIIKQSPVVLEEMFPGLKVQQVYVKSGTDHDKNFWKCRFVHTAIKKYAAKIVEQGARDWQLVGDFLCRFKRVAINKVKR